MIRLRRLALVTVSAGQAVLPRRRADMAEGSCGRACAILYYHGVTASQAGAFRRQMRWLAGHTQLVPLAECAQRSWTTKCTEARVRPPVCVTFDDAFANLLEHAVPVLQEFDIPATIFAVSGNLGAMPRWELPRGHADARERTMTGHELALLPRGLIQIGSHTHTHPRLSRCTPRQIQNQFRRSKCELEQIAGCEVTSLSMPFGDCPLSAPAIAAACGYKQLVTCARRVVTADTDPLQMGRFKVTPEDWPIEFRLKAAGAFDWLGRVRDGRRCLRSPHRITDRAGDQAASYSPIHGKTRVSS